MKQPTEKKESPTVRINVQLPRQIVEAMKKLRDKRMREQGRAVTLSELLNEALELRLATQERR